MNLSDFILLYVMNWCNATGLNFMKKLEYFKEEEWKEKEKGRGKLGKPFKAKIRLTFFLLCSAFGFGKNYHLCNLSLHK